MNSKSKALPNICNTYHMMSWLSSHDTARSPERQESDSLQVVLAVVQDAFTSQKNNKKLVNTTWQAFTLSADPESSTHRYEIPETDAVLQSYTILRE